MDQPSVRENDENEVNSDVSEDDWDRNYYQNQPWYGNLIQFMIILTLEFFYWILFKFSALTSMLATGQSKIARTDSSISNCLQRLFVQLCNSLRIDCYLFTMSLTLSTCGCQEHFDCLSFVCSNRIYEKKREHLSSKPPNSIAMTNIISKF